MLTSKKERSAVIQQSLMNRGTFFPISFFDSRKYIQHNVLLEDGLGPILEFMDKLPPDRTSVRVCRAIEDGDHSVVHNDYRLGDWGPMAAFEVHRWENDRIVEHWDNLQAVPADPNPSGRGMTDGPSVVTDLDKTDKNKNRIELFTKEVLIERKLERLSNFFSGDTLVQHNPHLGDGVPVLRASLESSLTCYEQLHKIIGEGNMVLAMSEGHISRNGNAPEHTSFYDLYRIDGGFIAEHWDVVESIAPPAQWRNSNGKF